MKGSLFNKRRQNGRDKSPFPGEKEENGYPGKQFEKTKEKSPPLGERTPLREGHWSVPLLPCFLEEVDGESPMGVTWEGGENEG